MRLFKAKRDAPAADGAQAEPRRRRRAPRAGGPRTIVPLVDEAAGDRPSWLKADAPAGHTPSPSPLALDLDAARERLRREIPPVADDA